MGVPKESTENTKTNNRLVPTQEHGYQYKIDQLRADIDTIVAEIEGGKA